MDLFKINLVIFLMGLFLFAMTIGRARTIYESKDREHTYNKGKAVSLNLIIGIVMIFIIPILNIFFVLLFGYVFLLASDDFYEKELFGKLNKNK